MPAHRTLFRASAGCGLPIGNQTSQFGANVYLDALDQFTKHELKARHYVRYCDDMVLLSADPAELAAWERAIGRFLEERLRLRLNDRRKLRPVVRSSRALAAARPGAAVAWIVPRAFRPGVEFRCPVPRLVRRFTQQTSWLLERLPGHVLMVREGPFVERITEGVPAGGRGTSPSAR